MTLSVVRAYWRGVVRRHELAAWLAGQCRLDQIRFTQRIQGNLRAVAALSAIARWRLSAAIGTFGAARGRGRGNLTLDHPGLVVESAARGFGIAYVAEGEAAERIATGELATLLDD